MTTRQVYGGAIWTKHEAGSRVTWDLESGDYQILVLAGRFRLVSFIHETDDDGNFWFRDFPTLDAAMKYAELI